MTKTDGAARPRALAGVFSIDPYVPGKSSAPGVAKIYKLSSNETPLGPSPRARSRPSPDAAAHLSAYPDGAAALCARRSAQTIRPRSGAHRLRQGLRRSHPSARLGLYWPGDEGVFTDMAFSSTRSPFSPRAARPSSRRKTISPPTSTPFLPRLGHGRESSFSPIRTIRPAPISPSPRSSALPTRLPRDVLLVIDAAYAEYATQA